MDFTSAMYSVCCLRIPKQDSAVNCRRLSRPVRRRYRQWRANKDDDRQQAHAEPVLERELRFVGLATHDQRGTYLLTVYSSVNEASILAVQVFDQKKFKKKDQGFLGVINIRVGDAMPEISPDADGTINLRLHASSTANLELH